MARRTKQEAQATREHLLDTAEQVFLARGLAGSSLQDIADAAGLTRGAIYWHFTDKPALFHAMTERVDLPLEQALAAAEQAAQAAAARGEPIDPLSLLQRLALEPFALVQRDPRARRVLTIMLHRTLFVDDLASLAQRQDDLLGNCALRMERLFQSAADTGVLADGVSPRAAALALLCLIDGLLRQYTSRDPSGTIALDTLAAAPQAIAALLAGLRRPADVAQ
jgi:TetR/AcrR family acrAB operon transcriptional repressor